VDIAGKHALITGASRGIGAVIAGELTSRGARCTLVARESETLHRTAAEHGSIALPADLSDPCEYGDLVARAEEVQGPLDIFVNNAARTSMRDFWELSGDELRGTLNINLVSAMDLARQAVRSMRPRGHGSLIAISSITGEFAIPRFAAYGPSKAALTMFWMILERELRGSGLTACVLPLDAVPGTANYNEAVSHPAVAGVAAQFERFGRLTPELVATKVADAVASDRRGVAPMPASSVPTMALRLLPVRLGDLIFARGDHAGSTNGANSTRD
jgi:NAD(P)-dependent dehydrogenase (short-subunit alcohol dehydrogenase family)